MEEGTDAVEEEGLEGLDEGEGGGIGSVSDGRITTDKIDCETEGITVSVGILILILSLRSVVSDRVDDGKTVSLLSDMGEGC